MDIYHHPLTLRERVFEDCFVSVGGTLTAGALCQLAQFLVTGFRDPLLGLAMGRGYIDRFKLIRREDAKDNLQIAANIGVSAAYLALVFGPEIKDMIQGADVNELYAGVKGLYYAFGNLTIPALRLTDRFGKNSDEK